MTIPNIAISQTILSILDSPIVTLSAKKLFRTRLNESSPYTKKEGALAHINVFFLPYDAEQHKIYLGHHKKADDWIPPGGHIEPGETPTEAVMREMKEELGVDISPALIEPWNLSVKEIGRPDSGCQTHYDIWHLVHIKEQPFDFLQGEYYDAGWFSIPDGIGKIAKNPDFADIVRQLSP